MTTLKLKFGGYSSAGLKEENQDVLAAFQPGGSALKYKGAVATIADGVSTADRAREASNLCATMFIRDYLETPQTWSVERSAGKIIRSLNSWCYSHGATEPEYSVSHSHTSHYLTTLSSIVFRSNTAYLFHVGDSRIYRWQDRELEQLTRDHSQVQGGRDFLTRAMGADCHIDVDFKSLKLQTGDVFMLSTDGVHNFVSYKQLKELFKLSHISLEAKAQAVVQRALDNGSDDNVSCLFVKVEALPSVDINESYQELSHLVMPPPLEKGHVLEGYEVLDTLFDGTRSTVYKVRCKKSKEVYALKAPSQNFEDDLIYLRGFTQEQWIGQQIDHPNVMKILPRKPDSQFLYHVCELIEGQTLRDWMVDHPQPSLALVRSIVEPVVSALRKMQRLDLVHRDLKPENIMICHDGTVKLVDFGTVQAASILQMDSAVVEEFAQGSVNYVAPESLLNNQCNHVSDIFSLGVIVYEMLANDLPYKPFSHKDYQPKSLSEWRYRSINKFNSTTPIWVDMVLRKACHPDPEQRFLAYSELMSELAQPSDANLNAIKNAPLLERNPVFFWQLLCAALVLVNLLQLLI